MEARRNYQIKKVVTIEITGFVTAKSAEEALAIFEAGRGPVAGVDFSRSDEVKSAIVSIYPEKRN